MVGLIQFPKNILWKKNIIVKGLLFCVYPLSTIVVSAFSKPDVRNKIFITLGLLLIYRLGALFPSPGVNYNAVQNCVATVSGNSFYDFVSLIC